ncbi:hypothetical protein V494_08637 [Pseudogymnoascus sp. VKM F-4513 (FW-928)]|nr:hypothetical protein V494_08637 [Pseudogymnoascus sp. VKM F-4513 (FW-928)]
MLPISKAAKDPGYLLEPRLSPNATTPATAASIHSISPRVVRYAPEELPSISFYATRSPDRQDSYGTS